MKRIVIAATIVVSLILYIFFVMGMRSRPIAKSIEPTPTIEEITYLDGKKLLGIINKYRISINLDPFVVDERLCQIANDRFADKTMSHEGFFYRSKNSMIPLDNNTSLGENLALVYTDQEAFDMWLASPKHKANMLGSWKYTCIATRGRYAIQIFSSFDTIDHSK